MQTLILGGMRSGKSRLAERLAQQSDCPVIYLATANAGDAEMAARIAHHRSTRPTNWKTVEAPIALASAMEQHAAADRLLLVDCLTLWLTNLLLAADVDPDTLARERDALLELLPRLPGNLILVSNETSMGIVPLGELTRRYCDEVGWLHQAIAAQADHVILTIAGLPHYLKGSTSQ